MSPLRWLLPASVLALAAAACAFIESPAQCATDSDCAQFDAVCNKDQAVCVARTGSEDAVTSGGDATEPAADGGGGGPALDPKCAVSPKPSASATAGLLGGGADGGVRVAGSLSLSCDKDWTLDAQLVVGANATLTIAAGTTIRAKPGASIVVLPGGKLLAEGQANAPIVLTSDAAAPKAGDWRGVILLGNAPRTGADLFENELAYGGNQPNDDSGKLGFVRIEYARSGLVLAAVGRGTKIDRVQVRHSNDNCFLFNGGTVDAKRLVCQQAFDEQFEIGQGYAGKLQFLFGQRVSAGEGHHGILVDGNDTSPVLYNVTLCGQGGQPSQQGSGLVFRFGAKLDANDMVITGWRAGIDALSANLGAPLTLRSSVVFGNDGNPSFLEADAGAGPLVNDDDGFDEVAFFKTGGNVETNPNLVDCHSLTAPKPWPAAALTTGASAPPAGDTFFEPAPYIGAFKDGTDGWMAGWTRFDAL